MAQNQRRSFNKHNSRGGGVAYSSSSFSGRSRGGGGRKGPKKDYINPSRFVQSAKPVKQEEYTPVHLFADFKVNDQIKKNLSAMGFEKPSPIQDQAIPLGLEGRDIVGIANTGTGKTAAFAIPMVQQLITNPKSRAIIMAPTRELAQQIEDECRKIGSGSGLSGALLIGGSSMSVQLRQLKANPRVIIGTPGRIKDHLERRSLSLENCNIVVLDEVDRMLDMGFIGDITEILSRTNKDHKQSFYFSATLDERVKGIIRSFSNDPVQISVKSGETSANVEQNVIPFNGNSDKIDKLHSLLIHQDVSKAIVFDDTHRSVENLSKELMARGFSVDSIHGGKSQGQRQRVLKKFKDSHISVLVATDVAARGLDVSDISHVVNYSSPNSYDDYVHRIGRTGRAGKIGFALTFIEERR